ncbi:MAG TPA: TlpA disulfide reductase family protein [Acidimicrobiales bacterium]|nr:TlpA disulfide reductase family protein [Acidimicrobiales bacterium]
MIALVVVAILAVVFLRPAGSTAGRGTGAEPGQQAPLFDTTDLTGQPVSLSSYRGHPVILNFWASWCIPCRAEFPVLKQLLGRDPRVVVLGVVFNDTDGPALAFMRQMGATWPGVRDPKSQIADAYDVHAKPGIPVSVLVDTTGRIVDRRYGGLTSVGDAVAFVDEAASG